MEVFNIISFVFFLYFIILIHRQWKKKNTKTGGKVPPGPWKLPIIGNMHQLSDAVQPTHRVLAELAKKYASQGLMQLQIGEISVVIVTSPAMAREFLKTHDATFASKPQSQASKIFFYNCSDIAFSPYGDHWRQMRKICVMELLSPKIVRSFSSIRHEEINSLLADLRSRSGQLVNVTERIFLLISTIICKSAFGKVFTGREEFLEQIQEISDFMGSFDFADMFPSWKVLHGVLGNKNRMVKAHRKVDAIVENIIKERREKMESGDKGSGDSFIDVLIAQMDSEALQVPITNDTVKAVITDMFIGGSESSASTTVWAMSEMMKNPRVLAKAQAEVREAFRGKEKLEEDDMEKLPYLKLVVKETLRCHPPFPVFPPKACREETVVNGFTIPVTTRVMIHAWAIGRDPEYWKDPDSFIPERFENSAVDFTGKDFQFLPFGSGRRMCPALAFGFANAVSPLAHLLFHFDWKLPAGITVDSFDMTEMSGLAVGRKNPLLLIPTPVVA